MELLTGIHHITALADDPQRNVDFYTGVLGLRLVKRTVNFDDPDTYHLYYGNGTGSPGTILTFFPYQGIRKGRRGKGMLDVVSFSVPAKSLPYWERRLGEYGISHAGAGDRFERETVLTFDDPDGLGLELVFNDRDGRPGFTYGPIPIENSIRGFYGAELHEEGYERTASLLTGLMGYRLLAEKDNRFRFAVADEPGGYLDIVCVPDALHGVSGGGTVHHIAFSTPDEGTQSGLREKIFRRMLNPTPVIDRQYFKSVYFREPGGILFEIATAGPGFAVDEPAENLGEDLKLPPQYERYRARIEKTIVPLSLHPETWR